MKSRDVKYSKNVRNSFNASALYTHVTCATDKDNIEFVFNASRHLVLRQQLGDSGMVLI